MRPTKWTRSATPAAAACSSKRGRQLAVAGDQQLQALVGGLRDRVDRDVDPLEVVGTVERRDERRDDRVLRNPEPRAGRRRRAGGEGLGVDAVRHFDERSGRRRRSELR